MIAAKQKMLLKGTTIGLLGGSFDPPHAGHVHITNQALQAFRLDMVWWLVSPRNPLKLKSSLSVHIRVKDSRKIIHKPKVFVSDIENRLNTHSTSQTLQKLFKCYPGVRFVWLMGADNLINFHKWDHWTWIMENIPVGVMARPGEQIKAGLSKTAMRYRKFRVKASNAAMIPFMEAPAWSLLGGPMQDISSTQIREQSLRQ
ncbi:MAG: nicotinate-nucleotide adenylyltransferase [Paracoccaceae bacterium]|nr:nicotinate-nucleotide adenylyltransferase [Paracoccaceae bacterium]